MNELPSSQNSPIVGGDPQPSFAPAPIIETVTLGLGSQCGFIEQDIVQPPPCQIPGLLPIPAEVEEMVAAEETRLARSHGFTLTGSTRQSLLHEQALNYFFRNQWVCYQETTQGLKVLAVGIDKLGQLLGGLSPEDLQTVRIKQA